jgi:putative endonuclease
MYSVYILYSTSRDTFYKGQTKDQENRLSRHNAGLNKSTKNGVPWILVWHTLKETRSEAMKLESKLKNLNRSRTILFALNHPDGIVGRDESLLLKRLSRC